MQSITRKDILSKNFEGTLQAMALQATDQKLMFASPRALTREILHKELDNVSKDTLDLLCDTAANLDWSSILFHEVDRLYPLSIKPVNHIMLWLLLPRMTKPQILKLWNKTFEPRYVSSSVVLAPGITGIPTARIIDARMVSPAESLIDLLKKECVCRRAIPYLSLKQTEALVPVPHEELDLTADICLRSPYPEILKKIQPKFKDRQRFIMLVLSNRTTGIQPFQISILNFKLPRRVYSAVQTHKCIARLLSTGSYVFHEAPCLL